MRSLRIVYFAINATKAQHTHGHITANYTWQSPSLLICIIRRKNRKKYTGDRIPPCLNPARIWNLQEYTLCPKNVMIFGMLNPEKIWHQWLVHFPTSPVYCSHFTLENPKKSFFNSIIHTYFRLFTLSQKKTDGCSLTTTPEKCQRTIPCKCTIFYLFQFFTRIECQSAIQTSCGSVATWAEFQQSVVDDAVDQWWKWLEACIRAEGGHFEHLL